jgi:hypothetical protein
MEGEANIHDERARRIVISELRQARTEASEPELNARLLLAIMYLEKRWPPEATDNRNQAA